MLNPFVVISTDKVQNNKLLFRIPPMIENYAINALRDCAARKNALGMPPYVLGVSFHFCDVLR